MFTVISDKQIISLKEKYNKGENPLNKVFSNSQKKEKNFKITSSASDLISLGLKAEEPLESSLKCPREISQQNPLKIKFKVSHCKKNFEEEDPQALEKLQKEKEKEKEMKKKIKEEAKRALKELKEKKIMKPKKISKEKEFSKCLIFQTTNLPFEDYQKEKFKLPKSLKKDSKILSSKLLNKSLQKKLFATEGPFSQVAKKDLREEAREIKQKENEVLNENSKENLKEKEPKFSPFITLKNGEKEKNEDYKSNKSSPKNNLNCSTCEESPINFTGFVLEQKKSFEKNFFNHPKPSSSSTNLSFGKVRDDYMKNFAQRNETKETFTKPLKPFKAIKENLNKKNKQKIKTAESEKFNMLNKEFKENEKLNFLNKFNSNEINLNENENENSKFEENLNLNIKYGSVFEKKENEMDLDLLDDFDFNKSFNIPMTLEMPSATPLPNNNNSVQMPSSFTKEEDEFNMDLNIFKSNSTIEQYSNSSAFNINILEIAEEKESLKNSSRLETINEKKLPEAKEAKETKIQVEEKEKEKPKKIKLRKNLFIAEHEAKKFATEEIKSIELKEKLFKETRDKLSKEIFDNEKEVESKKYKRLSREGIYNSGRWQPEEHKRFIEAILKFGNEWKMVQKYVGSRSSTQARSHAQKFFVKMKKANVLKFDVDLSKNSIKTLHELANRLNSDEYFEAIKSLNCIAFEKKNGLNAYEKLKVGKSLLKRKTKREENLNANIPFNFEALKNLKGKESQKEEKEEKKENESIENSSNMNTNTNSNSNSNSINFKALNNEEICFDFNFLEINNNFNKAKGENLKGRIETKPFSLEKISNFYFDNYNERSLKMRNRISSVSEFFSFDIDNYNSNLMNNQIKINENYNQNDLENLEKLDEINFCPLNYNKNDNETDYDINDDCLLYNSSSPKNLNLEDSKFTKKDSCNIDSNNYESANANEIDDDLYLNFFNKN